MEQFMEDNRQMLAFIILVVSIVSIFAMNMWAKRERRRTTGVVCHIRGTRIRRLNKFERVLAWLRII